MNSSLQLPTKSGRHGIPLRTALLVVLAVAMVGVGSLAAVLYVQRSERARLQAQLAAAEAAAVKTDLLARQAAENVRRTLALNRQQEVLTQTRAATNTVGRLWTDLEQLTREAAALRTNDTGRRLALHPELVVRARAFYDQQLPELPATPEVVTRLEGLRRIELQLATPTESPVEPPPELATRVQADQAWAGEQAPTLVQVQAALQSLIQDATVKVTGGPLTARSPNLHTALRQLTQQEATAGQEVIAARTVEAQGQAARALAEAEAERIRKTAEAKAAKMLADAEAQAAELRREAAARQAANAAADREGQVQNQARLDQARNAELRQKASDPKVKAKLAPFLTPGYAQIGGMSMDRQPHSFSKLQSSGALNPTATGMANLVEVAVSKNDKVRPRWDLNRKFWVNHPADVEQVKEAQQLLTELGPVMVEMGLLQP